MGSTGAGAEFTEAEIREQAQGNGNALLLVLLAYARERGQSPEEAMRFVGERFAPSWDGLRGAGARSAARAAALNLVSGGAELRSLTGDEDRAEAVVTGWPTDEDLAFFGLERADADASLAIFGPPAERLGLRAVWHRDGDALVVSFERAEGA